MIPEFLRAFSIVASPLAYKFIILTTHDSPILEPSTPVPDIPILVSLYNNPEGPYPVVLQSEIPIKRAKKKNLEISRRATVVKPWFDWIIGKFKRIQCIVYPKE